MKRYSRLYEAVAFKLPARFPKNNYKLTETLPRKMGDWQAKTLVGNSGGEVGTFKPVRYIAINLKNNEIIPISLNDEHQQGYEMLYEFQAEKKIQNARDWLSVAVDSNYIDSQNQVKNWLTAIQKWINYGGSPNVPISSTGYNGMPVYKVSFQEFLDSKGSPNTIYKDTRKIRERGKELLSNIERLARLVKDYHLKHRLNNSIFDLALSLGEWVKDYENEWFGLVYPLGEWDKLKGFDDKYIEAINKAAATEDVASLEEWVFGFNGFKNILHRALKNIANKELDAREKQRIEYVWGDFKYAVEELDRIGGI